MFIDRVSAAFMSWQTGVMIIGAVFWGSRPGSLGRVCRATRVILRERANHQEGVNKAYAVLCAWIGLLH